MIPNPAKAINARSGFPHRRISPRYRNLLNHPTRRKRGFTLVELLAVFAIIGVLAGSVNGLESTGQSAQIQSDAKILETAADRFFNESFPRHTRSAIPTPMAMEFWTIGIPDSPSQISCPSDPTFRLKLAFPTLDASPSPLSILVLIQLRRCLTYASYKRGN